MKHLIITFALLLFIVSPVIAEDTITNFTTVIPMPSGSIVAGSTYQTEYTFTGTINTEMSLNFTITHPLITVSDWTVIYSLNGNLTVPSEEYAGHFSENLSISPENYNLIIVFQSIPNVMPGDYIFDITITANETVITIPEEPEEDDDGFSGSRTLGNWTISGPTTLGTLTPTPLPAIIVQQITTENGTTLEITLIEEEPSKCWWCWILVILFILGLIYAYFKSKQTESKTQ